MRVRQARLDVLSGHIQVGMEQPLRPQGQEEEHLDGDGAVLAAAIGDVDGL